MLDVRLKHVVVAGGRILKKKINIKKSEEIFVDRRRRTKGSLLRTWITVVRLLREKYGKCFVEREIKEAKAPNWITHIELLLSGLNKNLNSHKR